MPSRSGSIRLQKGLCGVGSTPAGACCSLCGYGVAGEERKKSIASTRFVAKTLGLRFVPSWPSWVRLSERPCPRTSNVRTAYPARTSDWADLPGVVIINGSVQAPAGVPAGIHTRPDSRAPCAS
jgi:hypothetical protein